MINFLFTRIFQALIVMTVISLIAFAIRDSLGDPLRELVALSAGEEEREALREKLGLNDHFLVQYFRYITAIITQGDFGTSYFFKESTIKIILDKLPATIDLVIAATIIIIVTSIPTGIYCAVYPKSKLSKFLLGASIVGVSIPVFLTAILLISVFSISLNWLPSFGRGDPTLLFGVWPTNFLSLDGIKHLILPSITLASIFIPLFLRLTSSQMREVLQSEYIRFSWARGIKKEKIWYKHALKNTLIPLITVGGMQIGTMVAYTILTETVFQWPGMGFMFLEAIQRADIPLITTYLIFVGFIFVVVNTIVDILYGIINPVINLTGENK